MDKKINHDANIFYASLIIRNIRRGSNLSIDMDLYLDKIIEDIMFADEVLKRLMDLLNGNDNLINSEQYLRNIYLVKRDLVLLLEDIQGATLPISDHLKQYGSRFSQIIYSQKRDMVEVDDMLNAGEQETDKKNMVSSEEYQILFDTDD